MSKLRGYQRQVRDEAYAAWQEGHKNVLIVLPTGAGKTVVIGDIARNYPGYGEAIAHRQELVGQISMALAKEGVRHDLVAQKKTIKTINEMHMDELGRSWYDPRANWRVNSVDTLIRRDDNDPRYRNVGLVIGDEFHHFLEDNKWGKAWRKYPNARGLGVTATPCRADGKGLGRHADGLIDKMIVGPDMKWMINNGFLTPYEVLCIDPRDLDMSHVDISSATGDYVAEQMREAVKKSTRIIGDVVSTYLKYAAGQLGITFAVDIEHATDIAKAFKDAGVPAAVISSLTPQDERDKLLKKFKRRELLQLVNVDLFGEGFDLPAIQCVSMARPTMSYPLYVQQFGRALRLMISDVLQGAWDTYTPDQRRKFISESEKPFAYVFDHVGNLIRHKGTPDRPRVWTLDRTEKKGGGSDGIPLRVCTNLNPPCLKAYERFHPRCPYCGTEPPPPADRSRPDLVDGDLVLYTQEMLDALYADINAIDAAEPNIRFSAGPGERAVRENQHFNNQGAQNALRSVMQLFMPPGVDERLNNRRFFLTFGIDTLAAKGLKCEEAAELRQRILDKIGVQNA